MRRINSAWNPAAHRLDRACTSGFKDLTKIYIFLATLAYVFAQPALAKSNQLEDSAVRLETELKKSENHPSAKTETQPVNKDDFSKKIFHEVGSGPVRIPLKGSIAATVTPVSLESKGCILRTVALNSSQASFPGEEALAIICNKVRDLGCDYPNGGGISEERKGDTADSEKSNFARWLGSQDFKKTKCPARAAGRLPSVAGLFADAPGISGLDGDTSIQFLWGLVPSEGDSLVLRNGVAQVVGTSGSSLLMSGVILRNVGFDRKAPELLSAAGGNQTFFLNPKLGYDMFRVVFELGGMSQ